MDISNLLMEYGRMDPATQVSLLRNLNLTSEEELLTLINSYHVIQPPIEYYSAYIVHKKLLLYVPPILLLIGMFGNALAFLMFRTYSKNISTYALLSALAVMDMCVLNVGLLRIWASQLNDVDIKDQANWVCKVVMFLLYVCSDSSVWLIVAVTVERYFAVCRPLRAHDLCSFRRAKYVIVAPILVFSLVNAHVFFTVELTRSNFTSSGFTCDAGTNHKVLIQEVWPWVDAAIYSFVPFIILVVLNGLIIRQVFAARLQRDYMARNKRMRNNNPHNTNVNKSRSHSSRKLTMMLLLVSLTFLITTLPMNVTIILTASWNNGDTHSNSQMATFKLAKTVSELLMYVNHAINFYLYCITGRTFRMQIVNILCRCCHRRRDELRQNNSSTVPQYNLRICYQRESMERTTKTYSSV